jgi:hypothetical protein
MACIVDHLPAFVAGIAIVAVYIAATIPVRAEAKAREAERRLRAWGLALLLIPEIIVLKGEIEICIDSGTIYDAPVQVPAGLTSKTDQLYLFGETGGRLLQTIGMVNGVAAQTRRYQAVAISDGVPILGKAAAGMPIWQNNLATLRLCLTNLDEVMKQIQT